MKDNVRARSTKIVGDTYEMKEINHEYFEEDEGDSVSQ